MRKPRLDYAAAGVDTRAGDHAVELMKDSLRATHHPAVVSGAGGFAGLYDARELGRYRAPMLATSTDGVGTKVAIAQAMDVHDTIGQDLVGMVIDDIVVVGAKPLFMTDYIACGSLDPERIATVVRGIAEACRVTGTALIGGETAEHPGLLGDEEYDIAGAATGVVEAEERLGPHRVEDGDILLSLASSGLHANGYSLVRRILAEAGWGLERHVPELGRSLGEELLEPTRLYSPLCLELAGDGGLHALSHVTGGGLAANLARVLPDGLVADVARDSWLVPPIFQLLHELGPVAWSDLEDTLNLGVGMVALLAPSHVDDAQWRCQQAGIESWVLGEVRNAAGVEDDVVGGLGDVVSATTGSRSGGVRRQGRYRQS